MNFNIPGLDVAAGLDLYDGDERVYLLIIRTWFSDAPEYISKLRNVSAETLKDYAVTVHGFKGASASIGAEDVRQAAKKLEMMAKAGDFAGVKAENESFLRQAESLVKDIQNWLKQNNL